MDYRFTAVLILLLCALTFFAEPAYPRNEYLNDYPNECRTGEVDVSISKRERDQDYRTSNSSDYDDDSHELRLTFRKYLGNLQCSARNNLQLENIQLKQQLELMKMCGKVNNNPTLQHNPSFALLVAKCSGIIIPENKKPEGSHWDDLKDNYKKENPDITLMGDSKLLMPKDINDKPIILPIPKPVDEEAEWNAIDW